jgi:hypothetical protein
MAHGTGTYAAGVRRATVGAWASGWPAVAGWLALVAIVSAWPLGVMLIGSLSHAPGHPAEPAHPGLLLSSCLWALGIGVGSTLLALPVAWATGGFRSRWSAAALLPVLLPMPLAYAGLNELRAPGTAVGEWLAMRQAWAVLSGRAIAGMGLALWGVTLAACVLALGVRQTDAGVFEAARLEGRGPLRRALLALAITRWSVAASVLLVAAVMTGSAVPLHLARVPTFSVHLWLVLDASPPDGAARAWRAAWPLWALAAAVAIAAGLWLVRASRRDDAQLAAPRTGQSVAWLTAGVLAASSVVPIALLARSLSSWSTFAVLWRTEGGAIMASAGVAAVVGGVCAAACWTVRTAFFAAPRAVAAGIALASITAFAPGVLVGSVVAQAWRGVGPIADSPAIIVLAHLARLLAIPAAVGALLALAETDADRDRRRIDGATATLAAEAPGAAAAMLLVAAVCAAMSLSEMEASAFVQPPGSRSLAGSMLAMLHFSRYEHLSGLVLMIAGPTLLLAAAVIALAARTRPARTPVQSPAPGDHGRER